MHWPGVLLIVAIFGSVVIVIVLACAAVGFFAGALLIAVVRIWRQRWRLHQLAAQRFACQSCRNTSGVGDETEWR